MDAFDPTPVWLREILPGVYAGWRFATAECFEQATPYGNPATLPVRARERRGLGSPKIRLSCDESG
jgi:hypothetical protein